MMVQVVNTGSDLDYDQFDIAIPGGGQGATQGYDCPLQVNIRVLTGSAVRKSLAKPTFGALSMVVLHIVKIVTLCPSL